VADPLLAEARLLLGNIASPLHVETAVGCILRYLEERHEAASEPAPPTVSIHQLTIAPGGWAKLPDGRHVQNLADVVIVIDVRENTVRAPAAAVPGERDLGGSDLDALQALCDEATSGPWDGEYGDYDCLTAPDGQAVVIMGGYRDAGTHQRNARFVAAARDALPKLIAEVRRLRTMPVCSECNDLREGARCGACGEFIEDRDTEDGDAF